MQLDEVAMSVADRLCTFSTRAVFERPPSPRHPNDTAASPASHAQMADPSSDAVDKQLA